MGVKVEVAVGVRVGVRVGVGVEVAVGVLVGVGVGVGVAAWKFSRPGDQGAGRVQPRKLPRALSPTLRE